jgi:hypothetical protein
VHPYELQIQISLLSKRNIIPERLEISVNSKNCTSCDRKPCGVYEKYTKQTF